MLISKCRTARGLKLIASKRVGVLLALLAIAAALPAIARADEEPFPLPAQMDTVATTAYAALPEAPAPMLDAEREVEPAADAALESNPDQWISSGVETAAPGLVRLQDCPFDQTKALECRMHWMPLLASASTFLALQNTANLYTSYWYRYETMHGKWWDRYVDSVARWRWDHWKDDNPFLDDYIGHGMMGAITNSLWIENDPKGMTLVQSNRWPYWRSRLRAMEWSTLYSFE